MFAVVHCSKSPEPVQFRERLPEFIHSTTTPVAYGIDTDGTTMTENYTHEKDAYAINLLISPTIVPLLHELAKRFVMAGHHQQCCKIYKYVIAHCKKECLS